MKKFTVIALCFVLTAALMTACRSRSETQTDSPTTEPTATVDTATQGATETMPTMDDILPDMDATSGSDIMDDATGGTDNSRQRQRAMPME